MTQTQRRWVLCVVLGLLLLVYLLQPILAPFLVGTILAYLFDPIVERLESWRVGRTVASLIVIFSAILCAAIALIVLLPILQTQFRNFIDFIPEVIDWVVVHALPWLQQSLGVDLSHLNTSNLKDALVSHWRQAGDVATHVLSLVTHSGLALVVWISNLVLIPVVMFYLLRDWQGITQSVYKLIPKRLQSTATRLLSESDEVLGAFIRGQLLVMLGLAIIYSLGLWAVGLNMALFIGVLAGLLSVVPYLGFAVGLVVALIACVFQFQDLYHVIYVLIVFGIGQVLEGSVLTPLLVGDKIGLHPVAVIFAVLAGGQLFGFVGVLLALPVAAVIMVLLRFLHEQYLQSTLYTRAK